MTSQLKKYVSALGSAKNYIYRLSSDCIYADQAYIVPFPTLAVFNSSRQCWSVVIKAWVYLPFEGKKIKSYLPGLPKFFSNKNASEKPEEKNVVVPSDAAGATDNNEKLESNNEEEIYEDAFDEFCQLNENPGRLSLFFVGKSVKVVTKSIINDVERLLQPSDESGFIEEQLELPDDEVMFLAKKIYPDSNDRKFDYEIKINESKNDAKFDDFKSFRCTIYVLSSFGVSLISDIDDTIKISQVLNKGALLKRTFYDYYQPVEGMNELYQKWSRQKCQFHYVSASPWQLYPALREFLEKYQYPMGTMNLRKFSWSLKFLKELDTYKIDTITQMISSYGSRKYICVGDSGEFDPEIYSKLYTNFPENISHIFIRDLCTTEQCLPTCQERYKKAFEKVPEQRWTIFKHPKEIQANIDELIAA